MKRNYYALLAGLTVSLAALTSCGKNDLQPAYSDINVPQFGTLSFCIPDGIATKGVVSTDADTLNNEINHIQIWVFDSAGKLVTSGGKAFSSHTSATASSASDTVKVGGVLYNVDGLKVYALTNSAAESSQWASVASEDELLACVSDLKDNTVECMAAIGSKDNLKFSKDTTVTIPVKRFGSQIILKNVTTAFASTAYSNKTFVLTDIFLTNVQPTCPYSQVAANDSIVENWYDKMKLEDKVSDALDSLIAERDLSLDIKNGMSTVHHFYCYPNTTPLADDTHDTTAFCARRTRLVLATLLGDEVTYYPITLPKSANGTLESNKRYIISDVKITGPGVDDPEDPIGERGTVTYNVTIRDWETGETWSENY